jgi:hypothetical protein
MTNKKNWQSIYSFPNIVLLKNVRKGSDCGGSEGTALRILGTAFNHLAFSEGGMGQLQETHFWAVIPLGEQAGKGQPGAPSSKCWECREILSSSSLLQNKHSPSVSLPSTLAIINHSLLVVLMKVLAVLSDLHLHKRAGEEILGGRWVPLIFFLKCVWD